MRPQAAAFSAFVLLLATGPAAAQWVAPAHPSRVFVTVDAVQIESYQVNITGIVQGEAAPSTFYVQGNGTSTDNHAFAQACQQQALLAMAKPGQYLLTISQGAVTTLSTCKLTRISP